MGLPSIWVLVAVTVGGSMMGIVGMLIFIPLCSVLYALLRDGVNMRLGKKGGGTAVCEAVLRTAVGEKDGDPGAAGVRKPAEMSTERIMRVNTTKYRDNRKGREADRQR